MTHSIEENPDMSPSGGEESGKAPRIVLFSPDMDFCMSLRMLFQDRYRMSCTTDPDMLLTMVKTLQPELVIADCLPTQRMYERFRFIHSQNPSVKIMFFYFSPSGDRWFRDFIRNSGDVAFSKPIDLDQVTRTINSLVMHSSAV
jgi:PleD family two-component response regulator